MFFLEFSCFFYDPTDVGNLISGSSAFSKSSLNIWKFSVHVLLKPSLESFEHYFANVWDECNHVVVWTFFGIVFSLLLNVVQLVLYYLISCLLINQIFIKYPSRAITSRDKVLVFILILRVSQLDNKIKIYKRIDDFLKLNDNMRLRNSCHRFSVAGQLYFLSFFLLISFFASSLSSSVP